MPRKGVEHTVKRPRCKHNPYWVIVRGYNGGECYWCPKCGSIKGDRDSIWRHPGNPDRGADDSHVLTRKIHL